MRKNLIIELRRVASFYNISYPATAKLLREAACELEKIVEIANDAIQSNYNDDVANLDGWLNEE
jgi:hypothetical protein